MSISSQFKIKVIHGPNLNLLGKRETKIYGKTTLQDINQKLEEKALKSKVEIAFIQSNHEGRIIDSIHAAIESHGFLINPAAYTHTSIAIRDALLAVNKPFIEIHLSDTKKRESFRHHSYLADIALAVVAGKGADSYYEGFDLLLDHLKNTNP